MIIGVCTLQLELPAAHSLKEKRQILQSLMRRTRNEFNVSIGEVDHQDVPHSAILAIACVSTDTSHAHGLLTKVVNTIEQSRFDVILANFQIEFL